MGIPVFDWMCVPYQLLQRKKDACYLRVKLLDVFFLLLFLATEFSNVTFCIPKIQSDTEAKREKKDFILSD